MKRDEFLALVAGVNKDDLPEGVWGCLSKIGVIMTAEPEKFPTVESVVLNRIEMEAEVFMVMGLAGWETDATDFRSWVRTAKMVGMKQEECRKAVDRGAERGNQ